MKKILSLLAVLAVAVTALAYDFSATIPSGQTIYFSVTGSGTVKVVSPTGNGWEGYSTPAGRMVIPSTVNHGGTTYSVTSIDTKAFQECTALTSVEVPGSVVNVGNRAFARDESLTRVVVGEGVQRIDLEAFKMCSSLDTIVLPTTLVRVGASAFENTAFFNNNTNWTGGYLLQIGQWVIKVGNLVEGEVTVPDGITGIANSAFLYCRYMHRVDLPASLLHVGEGAFKDCEVLDTVRVRATVPPSLYNDSFMGIGRPATLIVPCNKRAVYQAADYWNDFTVKDTCNSIIGIETAEAVPPLSVSVSPDGSVVVRGAEGMPLTVGDMLGRTVCAVGRAEAEQRLALPAAGLYVLQAGGRAVKISYCCR